jgi:hypothetical protein
MRVRRHYGKAGEGMGRGRTQEANGNIYGGVYEVMEGNNG